jgi:hypothetical protein
VASPMPLFPPVMTAILPSSLFKTILLLDSQGLWKSTHIEEHREGMAYSWLAEIDRVQARARLIF